MQDIGATSNLKDIGRDIWKECQACNAPLKILLKKKDLLNRNQCKYLYKVINHVTKIFDYLITCINDGL